MKREVRILKKAEIQEGAPAKLVYMGPVVEVTAYQKKPLPLPCKPLDADHYVYTAGPKEGEICEYNHAETKLDSAQSVRRTLAHIRALINTNVTVPQNVRWVTLTYAENMTNVERLYRDFQKFWKRFVYWNDKQGFEKPEYISVVEPQGRGAWHVHAFFIWPHAAPYIDNDAVMRKLWGHGWTKTKAVKNCDNIGAYFSAYLADMELDEVEGLSDTERVTALKSVCDLLERETTDENGERVKKRILKGARLALYPPNMQIVRRSKGILNPSVEKTTYGKAKEKVSTAILTFSRAYEVVEVSEAGCRGSCVPINVISKEYYNLLRKESQEGKFRRK